MYKDKDKERAMRRRLYQKHLEVYREWSGLPQVRDNRYQIFDNQSMAESSMSVGDSLYKINAEDFEYLGDMERVLKK